MIDQDSAEFVEAFIAAVRPDEPRARPGLWMLIAALSAVLAVAAAALLTGALRTGPPGSAARLTAIAGPGCTGNGTSFSKVGYYAGAAARAKDWTTSPSGGYDGGGCDGSFVSVPLSGRVSAYDSNRYVLWTFRLGAALAGSADCALASYIPDVKSLTAVGGTPADYLAYSGAYGSSARQVGAFEVNQVTARGTWVPDVSFTVSGGVASVKMVDAGANAGDRAAAAQMRLTCSAK